MDDVLFNDIINLLKQDEAYNLENGNKQAALCYSYAIKMLKEYKEVFLKSFIP